MNSYFFWLKNYFVLIMKKIFVIWIGTWEARYWYLDYFAINSKYLTPKYIIWSFSTLSFSEFFLIFAFPTSLKASMDTIKSMMRAVQYSKYGGGVADLKVICLLLLIRFIVFSVLEFKSLNERKYSVCSACLKWRFS